jgi:threonine/homoserine/homoserine lactone efflux protein
MKIKDYNLTFLLSIFIFIRKKQMNIIISILLLGGAFYLLFFGKKEKKGCGCTNCQCNINKKPL